LNYNFTRNNPFVIVNAVVSSVKYNYISCNFRNILLNYIMSIIQPILTKDQINEVTNYINKYRNLNQAPPLVWDSAIQPYSQDWSFNLLSNNLFEHSGSTDYGENLAYFRGYGTDVMVLLKLAVDSWYSEISSYDFTKPGFSSATGHFTCLVWAASTNYAIAISINTTTSAVDIVFNTSPPGNVQGEYKINVLPVFSPVPTPPPPVPVPEPTPISNRDVVLKIINDLNNVIYAITKKQLKYFVIIYINSIINELSTSNIPISDYLINNLYTIIHAIKKKGYSSFIIKSLQYIIIQLNSYL